MKAYQPFVSRRALTLKTLLLLLISVGCATKHDQSTILGTWAASAPKTEPPGQVKMTLRFRADETLTGSVVIFNSQGQRLGGFPLDGDYSITKDEITSSTLSLKWHYIRQGNSLVITPEEGPLQAPLHLVRQADVRDLFENSSQPITQDPVLIVDGIKRKLLKSFRTSLVEKPNREEWRTTEVEITYPDKYVRALYDQGPRVNQQLQQWLTSPEPVLREIALQALSAINGKNSVALNLEMLSDDLMATRDQAVADLHFFYPQGPAQISQLQYEKWRHSPAYEALRKAMLDWLKVHDPDVLNLALLAPASAPALVTEIDGLLRNHGWPDH